MGGMAGQGRTIKITPGFSFFRPDADGGEKVNEIDLVELFE
jgi:hypothetical protein